MVDELFEVDADGRVILRLNVQPGAGRSEIVGRHGEALKVRVAAPPERARATDACGRLLAETFAVEPSAVTLVSGATSRTKRFAVAGLDADDVRAQLARVLDGHDANPASGRPPSRPRP